MFRRFATGTSGLHFQSVLPAAQRMRSDLAILCWCSLLLIGFSNSVSAYKTQSSQVEEALSEDGPFVLHPAMQQINPEIKGLAGYQPDLPEKNTWPELVGKDATEEC
ncbi:hypothetical protein WJX77_005791 [Trebouxia sp. C0004]